VSDRRNQAAPPQRRGAGGSRLQASDRVTLRAGDFETIGWTLNVSRGGMRLIVEESVSPGVMYELRVGDEPEVRRAKIVWVQDKVDGQIVGLKFVDVEGAVAPPEDPAPT
jgi:hypothetical protein